MEDMGGQLHPGFGGCRLILPLEGIARLRIRSKNPKSRNILLKPPKIIALHCTSYMLSTCCLMQVANLH